MLDTPENRAVIDASHEPYILVTAHFQSASDDLNVSLDLLISSSEINDLPWFGGDCGDSYFDDSFETDSERFEQRIDDCIHGCLSDIEHEYTGEEGEDIQTFNFTYTIAPGFKEEDFYEE
jgi:hypothetical protein